MAGDGDEFKIILYCMGIGGFFFVDGIRNYFKKKLIENTPTSKVRSIAMGFVELKGKAMHEKEVLLSPMTNSKCVYYRYKIEEYVKSGKSSYWRTIAGDESGTPFFLKDDSGKVLVDPKGAKIDIPYDFRSQSLTNAPVSLKNLVKQKNVRTTFLGLGKRMRYTEYYIAPNDGLFIMGTATSRRGSEKAVKNEDKILITKGTLNKTFYISDSSEKKILSTYRWKVPLEVFGGFALFIVGVAFLFFRIGIL